MARTPMSEILNTIADGLGSSVRVKTAVPADGAVYAMVMQGNVQATVEAHLNPIAQKMGTTLRRQLFSPGTVGPGAGATLYNARWRASKGGGPGFTVTLKHERKNVRVMNLDGRATYPLAILVGLAVGALFEYFWYPWMSRTFGTFFNGNPLGGAYIAAILVSTALMYWLFVKTTNVVYIGLYVPAGCAIASVVLSFFWGFIIGMLLGYWLVSWALNGSTGHAMREEVTKALQGASAMIMAMPPPVFAAAAPFPPAPPPMPAYGAPARAGYAAPHAYGAPAMGFAPASRPGYGAPAQAPRYAPPPPPPAAYGAPPPAYGAPSAYGAPPPQGSRPPTYPCHSCGRPVPEMAPSCPSCGTGIVWS